MTLDQTTRDRITIEGFLSKNGVGDRKESIRDIYRVNEHHLSDLPEWFVPNLAEAIRFADMEAKRRSEDMADNRFRSKMSDLLQPLYDTQRAIAELILKLEGKGE